MKYDNYSRLAVKFMLETLGVRRGQNVWIEYKGPRAHNLAIACQDVALYAKANPFIVDTGSGALNKNLPSLSPKRIEHLGRVTLQRMKTMQTYIRIDDKTDNLRLTVPEDILTHYRKAMRAMTDYRIENVRWLVVNAPTKAMAAAFGMTRPQFERYYLDVCLTDYRRMSEAAKPLQTLLEKGETVRIFSPAQNTDLRFRIAGIPAQSCTGGNNIPDGECFTAPVKDSICGTISFGPSVYEGKNFSAIHLTFEDGKVVTAHGGDEKQTQSLHDLLDTDEGARYVGEFALAFNPYITEPVGDILFDEKIAGSLHLALGSCYERMANNGNRSAIHFDMIHIQRPEYGGGEVWIDGQLIRKDGLFVPRKLQPLNPKNLMPKAAQKSGRAPR